MGKVPGGSMEGSGQRSARKEVSGAMGGCTQPAPRAVSAQAGSGNVKGGVSQTHNGARCTGNTWEGGGDSGPQKKISGAKG